MSDLSEDEPSNSSCFVYTGFDGNVSSGTTLKFNAPSNSDTMVKNGQTTHINTRHQCITAMKEYQMKSLEELRMEDYAANWKGKQPGSGGLFGTQPTATQQQSTGFNFGMTAHPFGQQQQQQQQQPASTGSTFFGAQPQSSAGALFDQANKPLFGTATTSTAGFGYGGSTGNSLFGNQNKELRMEDYSANWKDKPPGCGRLFRTQLTATQQQSTGFNFGMTAHPFGQQQQQQQQQPASTGSTFFGAQPQSSAGALFDQANKPLFGTATTSTAGFGYGGSTGNSLFGNQNKPLFGSTQAATTQSPLFGNTGTAGFGASTGFGGGAGGFGTSTSTGGLFGTNKLAFGATPLRSTTGFSKTNLFNKPAGTGLFGTPSQAPVFGISTWSSLLGAKPVGFGNTTSAPSFSLGATPGGVFGLFGLFGGNTAGVGFGASTGASTFTGFGGGFNTAQPSLNLGGASNMLSFAANPQNSRTIQQIQQIQQQLQQQLLALNHSPLGDSPLFWNLKQESIKQDRFIKELDIMSDLHDLDNDIIMLLKKIFSKSIEILTWLRAIGVFDDSKKSVMRNIVKNWISVKYNKEEKCEMCSNQGIAVGYCPDCLNPGFIDQLCMTYHEKIKELANHRVTDFRKDGYKYNIEQMVPLNFCTVHENLKLDYYCANCRKNICPSCVEKHTKMNHCVESVKDVLLVLSSMHDTRSFIQKTVSSLPISDSGERTVLQRLASSIDLTFGMGSGLATIAEIERQLENESPESVGKTKGSALLEEIRKIQNDLRTLFPADETIPKVPYNDVENEEDQHLALSRNCTFAACKKGPELIPNEHRVNMMENMSFQTTDHFPSFHQAPESEQDEKTPEQEIKALQKDLDNQINLDSYQDLHPYQ